MTSPTVPPPRPTDDRTTTETALDMPSVARSLRVLGRTFRLRCPECGRGAVFGGWMRMRDQCPACGLRFNRGDGDYFGGARFSNLVVAELLFVIAFAIAVAVTWPDVPWDALTYGGMAMMVVAPIVLYPFSKLVWLAMDVLVRPVTSAELAGGGRPR